MTDNPSTETAHFIELHANDDINRLALQASRYPNVDMPIALQQIEGRQMARRKLPSWAALEGIIYPVRLSLEQCSSERTALFKRRLIERVLPQSARRLLVDLTGGFGVDCFTMAPIFQQTIMVETQQTLCQVARHNARCLGINVDVRHGDGVEALHGLAEADLIYLDPARRDTQGARTFAIADCTPNVLELHDELLRKAPWVLLKLSPMLDWHEAVRQLGHVAEVHVVSVDNECKELLLLLAREVQGSPVVYCVNDDQCFVVSKPDELVMLASAPVSVGDYLYEPNASLMKAGCFGALCKRFAVRQVHPNSHLFVGTQYLSDFPGRHFQVVSVSTLSKSDLRQKVVPLQHANIAVRNFPMSVDALRKRLKLKEGGDNFIFATTIYDNRHVLLICRKCN